MRKSQLRQVADTYLGLSRQGAYRTRLNRRHVIHKMINDLFAIGEVPPKWYALNQPQVQKLVVYWQQKNISPITIMKYMTEIRWFLKILDHNLTEIDNLSLGLSRKKSLRKNKPISLDVLNNLSNPIAYVLLGLQLHFGLTLSEAMRVCPDISIRENNLWITRDIASNSMDKVIPIRSVNQKAILEKLRTLTQPQHCESLISTQGYDAVRYAYRKNMKSLKYSPRKSYRYFYAKMLYEQLSPSLSKPKLILLIMREMGLQSRVTLWGYLKE